MALLIRLYQLDSSILTSLQIQVHYKDPTLIMLIIGRVVVTYALVEDRKGVSHLVGSLQDSLLLLQRAEIHVVLQRDPGTRDPLRLVLMKGGIEDVIDLGRLFSMMLPIEGVQIPKEDLVAHGEQQPGDTFIQLTIRRPHIARTHAYGLKDGILGALHLTSYFGI